MIRKLMASTAVLALMSTGAFTIAQAQSRTSNPRSLRSRRRRRLLRQRPSRRLSSLLPRDADAGRADIRHGFIGRSVYSSEDPESDNIGDINDLIVSEDGSITHAVVGVGGFLGIGEKDVAVPFDELQVVERDGDIRLVYASTREQLEAAPALDRTAFDPAARAAEEQAAQTDTGTVAPAPVEPSQDMAAAPAAEPAAPAEEETAAATTVEAAPAVPAQDLAAAPVEEPAAPAEEETAAAPVEEAAPAELPETAAAPAEEPAAPARKKQRRPPRKLLRPSRARRWRRPRLRSQRRTTTAPAEQDVAAAPRRTQRLLRLRT